MDKICPECGQEYDSEPVNLVEYEKVFVGSQFAVGLVVYTSDQVGIQLLMEDDGSWFKLSDNYFSAYWLKDLVKLLNEAEDWMRKNCDPFYGPLGGSEMGWQWRR